MARNTKTGVKDMEAPFRSGRARGDCPGSYGMLLRDRPFRSRPAGDMLRPSPLIPALTHAATLHCTAAPPA